MSGARPPFPTEPRPAAELAAVQAWVRERAGLIEDDLRLLVETESPSDDLALLRACRDVLVGLVVERLGEPASREVVEGESHGDAVVLDYPGAGERPVVMICHYDTVWGAGTVAGWPYSREGARATGPGVFDMKAGCVQAVWALLAARECGLPLPPLRLVLNGDEEIGSPFSRPVIERAVADAALAVVMEPGADGAVKVARKGIGRLRIRTAGVAAHAGLDYWAGVSAIDELARVTLAAHAISDRETGTTVNVGTVTGGTRSNVVAETAAAEADVRIERMSEIPRIEAQLAAIVAHSPRATVELDFEVDRPPMEAGPVTLEPYALAAATARELGFELGSAMVGGASDGNYVAAAGIPTLDGMGAIGSGAHARSEHIDFPATVDRIALVAGVVSALASA